MLDRIQFSHTTCKRSVTQGIILLDLDHTALQQHDNRSQSWCYEYNGSGRAADTGPVRSQEKKVSQDTAITLPEKLTHRSLAPG